MNINTTGLADRRDAAGGFDRYGKRTGNGAFGQALRTGYASSAGSTSGGYHCTLRTGWLYSAGSPATGQELHMKYDESSTQEDPVIYVEGKDISGRSFQKRIRLADIDINHASLTEMTALRAHLAGQGDRTVKARENLPLMALAGQQDVNRRMDFAAYLRELASANRRIGDEQGAQQYLNELERYLLFLHAGRRTAGAGAPGRE